MLQPNDYVAIKQRVLLAAEVANRVANSPDTVRFDQETYLVVQDAMARNRDDILALLTELDILRSGVGAELFPSSGSASNASDERADDQRTVESVPPSADERGGSQVPDDNAGHGGPVQASGLVGERPSGSKPRRNRKSKAGVPKALDAGSPAEPVGGLTG